MSKLLTIKDQFREARIFTHRAVVALFVMGVLLLLLVFRVFQLQVVHHEKYQTLSEENRLQDIPIPPRRGLIYDRNGILLADNQPSVRLVITPEKTPDLDATLAELGTLIRIEEEDIADFHKRLQRHRRPLEPMPIRYQLNDAELATIAVHQHRLIGVALEAVLVRHYLHDELFSHAIGYVNRINEADLKRIDPARYEGTLFIGRVGIESFYEEVLHGEPGIERIETNVRNQRLRVVEQHPPKPGANLTLHLDYAVQKAADEALAGRRGAVVAIDVKSGGVLAFVSHPGFDTNLFVTGISHTDYSRLRDDHDQPLFNRALVGQYPPGSTIKPFMAFAGIESRATNWDYSIRDPGYFRLPNDTHRYRDWKKEGHGTVRLHDAVVQSCDTYFYELAVKMGIDEIHRQLAPFSFGRKTGIDLEGEKAGILPSREWKRAFRNESWYLGDTIITAIGQGFNLSTPLQLATATAILARRGEPLVPRLVKSVDGNALPQPAAGNPINPHFADTWDRLFKSMEDVVSGERGTARIVGRKAAYSIAGKTGTAQVFSVAQDEEYDEDEVAERLKDHALFVAFAPVDDPQIAVAVIVENGSHGGSTAGPVARKTLDAYMLPRLQAVANGDAR